MLANLKSKATQGAAFKLLAIRKESPKLMFAAGIVGFVATVALSGRAALQTETILREAEEKKQKDLAQMDQSFETSSDGTTQDVARFAEAKSKVGLYIRTNTAMQIARAYAPTVVVGVLSITALTGSHVTLSRRNVGLTAAYAALDKGFRQYRERVVEEFGAEKDQELRYGFEMVEQAVDTEEGPVVKTVKVPLMQESIYARIFDGNTSRHWSPEFGKNQLFLKVQEQYANDLLHAKGYVFLNQVLAALGLEECSAGQIVGWVLPENGGDGDGHIDFGIFRDIEAGRNFAQGGERSVLLDFNVDGDILALLDEMKAAKKRAAAAQVLQSS